MYIKSIEKDEINAVVEVHRNSFKDFFLSTLGDNFLSLYYDSIRRDNNAILLGIYDENQLSGFCAATFLSKGFNKQLIKNNFFRFVIIGLELLIKNPGALVRLIRNFRKNNSDITDNGLYSELLSIGVSDDKQGKGIGKKLLIGLESELKNRGCTQLSLTTDFYNNIKAIEFYKGLGYSVFYDFIAYPDRKMYRLIKKIN